MILGWKCRDGSVFRIFRYNKSLTRVHWISLILLVMYFNMNLQVLLKHNILLWQQGPITRKWLAHSYAEVTADYDCNPSLSIFFPPHKEEPNSTGRSGMQSWPISLYNNNWYLIFVASLNIIHHYHIIIPIYYNFRLSYFLYCWI